jgi:MSHA biogenesis protein MshO
MTHRFVLRQRGFTLIELVMVIVILGVIGGMVAVFMRAPIQAYFDTGRRAALTDVADTAVRRMARDIRTALPNSVRVPNALCLEFIPTKTGGRYRADDTAAGLNFAAADASFNMLGSNAALPADQQIVQGDVVVVYNLGIAGASAYAQNNTAVITAAPVAAGIPAAPETTIAIANTLFPLASPASRFQVVPGAERVVAFVCNPAARTLRRTVSAAFNVAPQCPANGPILATNVTGCAFTVAATDLQRNALVSMGIQLTSNGEVVNLQHQVQVSNTP